MAERGSWGRRARRSAAGWWGRADGGPPDPSVVALVEAVLPLLGDPERWAVYTVPGPRDLPGPEQPQWRRDRWWREHISAVGGALMLVDPNVDQEAIRQAVELLVASALARDRGTSDPATIVAGLMLSGAVPVRDVRAPTTAIEVVRVVADAVTSTGSAPRPT